MLINCLKHANLRHNGNRIIVVSTSIICRNNKNIPCLGIADLIPCDYWYHDIDINKKLLLTKDNTNIFGYNTK